MLCAASNNFIGGFHWSVGQQCKGKQLDWDASNPFAFIFLLNMCVTKAWRVRPQMLTEQRTIGCTRRTGASWIGNDFSPSYARVHSKCNSLSSMKKLFPVWKVITSLLKFIQKMLSVNKAEGRVSERKCWRSCWWKPWKASRCAPDPPHCHQSWACPTPCFPSSRSRAPGGSRIYCEGSVNPHAHSAWVD